jgi:hypothetical protein
MHARITHFGTRFSYLKHFAPAALDDRYLRYE